MDTPLSDGDAIFYGEAEDDYAGYALSGAGDVDGDGLDDLLIGAYGSDDPTGSAGAAYLVLGGTTGTMSLAGAHGTFIGEAGADVAGQVVSGAGDANADGYADLLIADAPNGSTRDNMFSAMENGDVPGIGVVIIDSVIRVFRSRNSPPPAKVPRILKQPTPSLPSF